MTDPSSNTASFQLKNVLDSISNSHQQSNLDSRFISDSISLISNNSLISSSHSQSSIDSNSSRVLKSYLSTTSSLLKINSSSSSSTSSNRYRILLSTLLATQFIQQLGLNHSLLSSSSNSTSLLEQWLNSSSNLLLSNSTSKNLILDNDSTISTQLLASILDLITNHLLGSKSGLKPDYHRNVVVKNVPKLANGLLNLLDNLHHIVEQRGALDRETEKKMYLILASLDLQLLLHTSLYRPLSSKIHSQLLKLLFTSSNSSISTSKTLINPISVLLSHLHLTGVPSSVITKPSAHNSNNQTRTSQPVLWKSTLDSTLNSSIETWKVFIKDFPKSNHHESQVELDDLLKGGAASRLDLKPLNENGDGDVALESLKRLRVLFGEKGLLETLLTTSTTRYIPLPAYKIISFCCLILSTVPPPPPSSNSNASNHFINTSISSTINSTTFAFQKSHLIEIQSMALKIGLLTLSIIEDQITISHRNLGPKFLETILNLLSNKHLNSNSSFKAMCFKTLAVLICDGSMDLNPSSEEQRINGIGLLLDPNDRNLIKLARFSLGQIGRFLNTRSSIGVEQSTSNTSSANRQNKKPKLSDQSENDVSNYNSIATHLWPNFSISENDFSSTKSSLYILINLYPFFQTKLNKNLKELESLTNNVLLGLVELLLNNRCLGSGNVSLLMNRNISTESFQINENVRKLDDLTCLTISSLTQILKYLDQISLAKVLPRLLKLVNTYSLKGNSLSPQIVNGLIETRELAEMILMPRSVPFISEDVDLGETSLEDQDEDVEMDQEEVDPKGKGKQIEMGLISKDKSKLKSWGIGQDDEDQMVENSNPQEDQDQEQDQDEKVKEKDQDEEMLDQQEKEIQQQKRNDLDAFKQTLNDQKSNSNAGGGRKSSSSTNFSPDPVKSIRRPSTPRIGSPTSKLNNNPSNPEHSMGGGNFEAKDVFGRQSEKGGEIRDEKRKEKEKEETMKALEMEVDDDDDDDDDDEMPEIDMRGSEDESEGEE